LTSILCDAQPSVARDTGMEHRWTKLRRFLLQFRYPRDRAVIVAHQRHVLSANLCRILSADVQLTFGNLATARLLQLGRLDAASVTVDTSRHVQVQHPVDPSLFLSLLSSGFGNLAAFVRLFRL